MKFYTAILLASFAATASAFSAVVPTNGGASVGTDAIDKSMRGIDAEGSFDPTEGDNSALTRNNNDQVWVPQV